VAGYNNKLSPVLVLAAVLASSVKRRRQTLNYTPLQTILFAPYSTSPLRLCPRACISFQNHL